MGVVAGRAARIGHRWAAGRHAFGVAIVFALLAGCTSAGPAPPILPATVPPTVTDVSPSTVLPESTEIPEGAVGNVSCTADGPIVTSPTEARPDGVHFFVVAPQDVFVDVREALGRPTLEGIGGPPGATISILAPGDYLVGCRGSADDVAPATWVPLSIVDPRGLWVDDRVIDCPDRSTGIADYGEGTQGERGDLVEAFKRRAQGLLPGDEVSRAGYPEATPRRVRVVRAGRIVALAEYEEFETPGNWVLGTYTYCTSIGPRSG